ncbi:MAG: hypothetical protein K0Q72_747 [Armatimonadetes bacterium]|nr:hypothetical protein [Armatimonadota bacterium]
MRWLGNTPAAADIDDTLWLVAVFVDRLLETAGAELSAGSPARSLPLDRARELLLQTAAVVLRDDKVRSDYHQRLSGLFATPGPQTLAAAKPVIGSLVSAAAPRVTPDPKRKGAVPEIEAAFKTLAAAQPDAGVLELPDTEALLLTYLQRLSWEARALQQESKESWLQQLRCYVPRFQDAVRDLCADPAEGTRAAHSIRRLFISPDEAARRTMLRELEALHVRMRNGLKSAPSPECSGPELKRIVRSLADASPTAQFTLFMPIDMGAVPSDGEVPAPVPGEGVPVSTTPPSAPVEVSPPPVATRPVVQEYEAKLLEVSEELARVRASEAAAHTALQEWRGKCEELAEKNRELDKGAERTQADTTRVATLQRERDVAVRQVRLLHDELEAFRHGPAAGARPPEVPRLERERDQARKAAAQMEAQLRGAEAERDKARSEVERLEREAKQRPAGGRAAPGTSTAAMPPDVQALRTDLARAAAETVELRRRIVGMEAASEEASRQRDELRRLREETVPTLQAALKEANRASGRIGILESELKGLRTQLQAREKELEAIRSKGEAQTRADKELRALADLSLQVRNGIEEVKTRYPKKVVTDKLAILLNHCLTQLTLAVVTGDRTRRTAMLANLRTLATALENAPYFPAVLGLVARLEPELSELEAAFVPSPEVGAGYYFFQEALAALRSDGLEAAPFHYDLDGKAQVRQVS